MIEPAAARAGLASALAAVALWASLAVLGLHLAHLPPFLLTGLALLIGSVVALPWSRFDFAQWRVPPSTLLLGVGGLFGFHLLLFVALRLAPPVEANLVNYLWPLFIVLGAPLLLPGTRLAARHVAAAFVGLAGAALAISGGKALQLQGDHALGYAAALGSALVWAGYSLLTRRVRPFPTAAIGAFCLVSGLLSLGCHLLFEPPAWPRAGDWTALLLMGLGPMGAAFFLWDRALKAGDARQIGVLSFLTPLGSTLALLAYRGQPPGWAVLLAAPMIVGAAVLASREQRR